MNKLVFAKRLHYFLTFHTFLAVLNLFFFLGSHCTFALITSIAALLNLLLGLSVKTLKLHRQIFNLGYLFLLTAHTIIISQYPSQIIISWLISLLSPILVLIFTASYSCLAMEIMLQILSFALFFKGSLRTYLENTPVDDIVSEFTGSTIAGVLLCGVLLLTSSTLTNLAFDRITQIKDEEIANIKTSLHSFTHEMRNPINSVMGNMQLALLENLPEAAKNNLKAAKLSGEILLHLVNNILDEGKAQFGELEIELKPTKIHECFEKVWTIGSELTRNKGLQGYFKVQKGFPERLNIDEHRICQVLLNLLGNAVKFTDKGHISVTAHWLKDAELTPKCFEPLPFDGVEEGLFEKNLNIGLLTRSTSDDPYDMLNLTNKHFKFQEDFDIEQGPGVLKIEVFDTGCGITEEGMKKLFRKYSQVNSQASKRKVGTGLGLYITKQLVERMKGEIKVYSKPGKGTCFTVCIPTYAVQLPRASSANSLNSLSNEVKEQHARALVVDNSEFNSKTFKKYLEKLGFKDIVVESDSIGAIKAYEQVVKNQETFDMILVGRHSSLIAGKEAVRLIREYEKGRNLKRSLILMLNQSGHGASRFAYHEEVLHDYLLREPVCFRDLFKIVQDNVGRFSGLALHQ